jgi:hypothetical protein
VPSGPWIRALGARPRRNAGMRSTRLRKRLPRAAELRGSRAGAWTKTSTATRCDSGEGQSSIAAAFHPGGFPFSPELAPRPVLEKSDARDACSGELSTREPAASPPWRDAYARSSYPAVGRGRAGRRVARPARRALTGRTDSKDR